MFGIFGYLLQMILFIVAVASAFGVMGSLVLVISEGTLSPLVFSLLFLLISFILLMEIGFKKKKEVNLTKGLDIDLKGG